MEVMCNPSFLMMDGEDPLNFTLDDVKTLDTMYSSANINSTQNPDDDNRTFHESGEEELEWILNKDLFPAVETGLDIFAPPDHNNKSPSSVLDNNINGSPTMSYNGALPVPIKFKFPLGLPPYPRKKRSDRKRKVSSKMLMMMQQMYWGEQVSVKNAKQESRKSFSAVKGGSGIGRKCQHCLAEKTPQWRAGPMGPKTLCNACGVRYKSGRLVPEYRPASSPTFSSELHSNSHRKIVEMRRRVHGGDVMVK